MSRIRKNKQAVLIGLFYIAPVVLNAQIRDNGLSEGLSKWLIFLGMFLVAVALAYFAINTYAKDEEVSADLKPPRWNASEFLIEEDLSQ